MGLRSVFTRVWMAPYVLPVGWLLLSNFQPCSGSGFGLLFFIRSFVDGDGLPWMARAVSSWPSAAASWNELDQRIKWGRSSAWRSGRARADETPLSIDATVSAARQPRTTDLAVCRPIDILSIETKTRQTPMKFPVEQTMLQLNGYFFIPIIVR